MTIIGSTSGAKYNPNLSSLPSVDVSSKKLAEKTQSGQQVNTQPIAPLEVSQIFPAPIGKDGVIFLNPAYISMTKCPIVSYWAEDRFEGALQKMVFTLIAPLNGKDTLSLGYSQTSVADIPLTAIDSSGKFIQTGSFSDEDNTLSLGFSIKPLHGVTMAGGLNYLFGRIYDSSYSASSFDLGVSWYLPFSSNEFGLMMDASINNVGGTKIPWSTGSMDTVPMTTSLGGLFAAKIYAEDTLYLSVHNNSNSPIDNLSVAAKYVMRGILSLSAGYDTGGGLTYGVGLNLNKLKLDYNYRLHPELGGTQQVGFGVEI